MTPTPPPEEAPFFRGNTLTPESPRPVHVPEPSNIPVLENQTDPIFNLMASHVAAPVAAAPAPAGDGNGLQEAAEPKTLTDIIAAVPPRPTPDEERIAAAGKSQEQVVEDVGVASLQPEEIISQPEKSETFQFGSLTDVSTVSAHPSNATVSDTGAQPSVNLAAPESIGPTQHSTAVEDQPQPSNTGLPVGEMGVAPAHDGPVNYQALIDTIVPSRAADASREGELETTPTLANIPDAPASDSLSMLSPNNPPSQAGLPPRPPPQEKPAIHPNYDPDEDIRSYHFPNLAQPSPTTPQNGTFPTTQTLHAPGPASNPGSVTGAPPPPGVGYPTFLRQNDRSEQEKYRDQRGSRQSEAARRRNQGDREDNTPWGPDIQMQYDQFLADEAIYTAEGTWDRFPKDSRLFVGNLPSELVTKRDIFHIFYRYGRLAQISIKNAYGFVQFMDESACRNAMHSEQGKKIKDKSMHLEVSKPPKNARNAAVSAAGERLRASHYRRSRSRSPDQDRRPGSRSERSRASGDFRDQFRRGRDDYRPGRSPSPPRIRNGVDSYRGRDRSSDRHGRRDRSRSPYNRYRNRSPSPRRKFGEDDDVPLPRRDARDVPEVQIIVMDQLDRGFVEFVQNAFRAQSLSAAVLAMPPQATLDAVIKRQIMEGVLTVVKLFRESQMNGKIAVQIFDRSGGRNSVRFDEYRDLDPHIAASLVAQSKQKQAAVGLSAQPQQYGAALQQLGINLPSPQIQQQGLGQPNLAQLITQLDGPALQRLLGAMQQQPSTPVSAHSLPQQSPTQIMGFGNVPAPPAQPPNPTYNYPPQYGDFARAQHQPSQPPHPAPQQAPQAPVGAYSYPTGGSPPNPNQVQDIMSQLAQWRR